MERELILSLKDKDFDRKKVETEIEIIKKMLPLIESFESFYLNNEVFDMSRHKLITKNSKLMNVFEEGVNGKAYFIFCKN